MKDRNGKEIKLGNLVEVDYKYSTSMYQQKYGGKQRGIVKVVPEGRQYSGELGLESIEVPGRFLPLTEFDHYDGIMLEVIDNEDILKVKQGCKELRKAIDDFYKSNEDEVTVTILGKEYLISRVVPPK